MKNKTATSLVLWIFFGTQIFADPQPEYIWPIESTYGWRFMYEASDGLLYSLRGDGQWMYSENATDWSAVDGYPGTINGNGISVLPYYSKEYVPDYTSSSVFPVRLNSDGTIERILSNIQDRDPSEDHLFPGIEFKDGYWWRGAMWFDRTEMSFVIEAYRSEDTYNWEKVLRVSPRNHIQVNGPIWRAQLLVMQDKAYIKFVSTSQSEWRYQLWLLSTNETVPTFSEVDWRNGEIVPFNNQFLANMGESIVDAESGDLVAQLEMDPYTTYTPAGGLVLSDRNSQNHTTDLALVVSSDEPIASLIEISGTNFLRQFALPVSGGIQDMREGDENYVMLGTEGEIIFSDNGLDWEFASLHLSSPRTIDYANGEYRIVTDSVVYSSLDGESWSQLDRKIPPAAVRFSPEGFGELAESEDWIWHFTEDGEWEQLAENGGPPFYIPELDLVICQSVESMWFDSIRGGERHSSFNRLDYFSNGFEWSYVIRGTMFGTGIGSYDPIPPLDHQILNAIDYGNGLFYSDLLLEHDLLEAYLTEPDGSSAIFPYAVSAELSTRTESIRFTGDRFLGTTRGGRVFITGIVPERPVQNGFLTQNGWVGSDWFDWVNTRHFPWLYKWDLGWVLSYGGNASNCWFWDTTVGLFWTSRSHYPTVYTESEGWFRHPKARIR